MYLQLSKILRLILREAQSYIISRFSRFPKCTGLVDHEPSVTCVEKNFLTMAGLLSVPGLSRVAIL